jgi:glucose-1-phosphate cytidylyltransferase
MDNVRERDMLEKLLQAGKAPWKKWDRVVPQKC